MKKIFVHGAGIAQAFAAKGFKVIIRDIKEDFVDKELEGIKKNLTKLVGKGKLTEETMEKILCRISGTIDINLAKGTAAAEDIDKAMMLGANHPMGPLSLSDFIGNDIVLAIMEVLHREIGDPKYRPHTLLRKYVRAGYFERKTGRGFFNYN